MLNDREILIGKDMENRRTFTRVLFSIDAKLTLNNQDYPVTLHDISMAGALVSCSTIKPPLKDTVGILNFSLADDHSTVTMDVNIVHTQDTLLRLNCNSIDINSISVLRRLIELNLGDSEQLNKELSELSYSQN